MTLKSEPELCEELVGIWDDDGGGNVKLVVGIVGLRPYTLGEDAPAMKMAVERVVPVQSCCEDIRRIAQDLDGGKSQGVREVGEHAGTIA